MKKRTPLKSIRAFCLQCSGSPKQVRFCPATQCALHPFRMGRNPNRTGIAPNAALLNKKSCVVSKEMPKGGLCGDV